MRLGLGNFALVSRGQECLNRTRAGSFSGPALLISGTPHLNQIYPISTALCSLCSLPSLCPLPPSIIHHPSSTSSSFLRQPLHFFLHPSHTRRGKLCLLYLPHHHSCPSLGHLRHELSWFHRSARKCPETRLFGSALGCCCACRDPPTSTTPLLLRCGIGPLPVPAGDGR